MKESKKIVRTMTSHPIVVVHLVKVTMEDIDDIMVSALEDGICYWCCKAEVVGRKYLGEYASDQIARGGFLKLHDADTDHVFVLNLDKFLKGLNMWLERNPNVLIKENDWYRIDVGNIDAVGADSIVQLALFGEEIFG